MVSRTPRIFHILTPLQARRGSHSTGTLAGRVG